MENPFAQFPSRSRRYQLTDHAPDVAVLFTKTHTRIVNPALAEPDPHLPDEVARTTALGEPVAHSTSEYNRSLSRPDQEMTEP